MCAGMHEVQGVGIIQLRRAASDGASWGLKVALRGASDR